MGDSKGEHPLTNLEQAGIVNYAAFFRKMEYRQWKPRFFFLASVGGMTALNEKNIRCQEALSNS